MSPQTVVREEIKAWLETSSEALGSNWSCWLWTVIPLKKTQVTLWCTYEWPASFQMIYCIFFYYWQKLMFPLASRICGEPKHVWIYHICTERKKSLWFNTLKTQQLPLSPAKFVWMVFSHVYLITHIFHNTEITMCGCSQNKTCCGLFANSMNALT